MGYDSEVAKICRLSNGWEIEVYDPPPKKEQKAEAKESAKGGCCPSEPYDYKSPWRTLAFSTLDEALKFLKSKEADLKPRNYDDEYASAFAASVADINKPKKAGK